MRRTRPAASACRSASPELRPGASPGRRGCAWSPAARFLLRVRRREKSMRVPSSSDSPPRVMPRWPPGGRRRGAGGSTRRLDSWPGPSRRPGTSHRSALRRAGWLQNAARHAGNAEPGPAWPAAGTGVWITQAGHADRSPSAGRDLARLILALSKALATQRAGRLPGGCGSILISGAGCRAPTKVVDIYNAAFPAPRPGSLGRLPPAEAGRARPGRPPRPVPCRATRTASTWPPRCSARASTTSSSCTSPDRSPGAAVRRGGDSGYFASRRSAADPVRPARRQALSVWRLPRTLVAGRSGWTDVRRLDEARRDGPGRALRARPKGRPDRRAVRRHLSRPVGPARSGTAARWLPAPGWPCGQGAAEIFEALIDIAAGRWGQGEDHQLASAGGWARPAGTSAVCAVRAHGGQPQRVPAGWPQMVQQDQRLRGLPRARADAGRPASRRPHHAALPRALPGMPTSQAPAGWGGRRPLLRFAGERDSDALFGEIAGFLAALLTPRRWTQTVVQYDTFYGVVTDSVRERTASGAVSNRGTRGRSCCGVGWAWRSYPRPACGGTIADLTVVTGAVFDAADRPGHDPAGIAARLTAPAPKLRRAPKPGRLQILSQPAETGQRRQPGRVRFAVLLTMWPDMTRSRDERVTDQ